MADPPPIKPPQWTRQVGIGVEYAAAVGAFIAVGWWVDSRWDTRPWGILIGAVLGLVGATYNLVRTSLAAFEDVRRRESESRKKRDDSRSSD